MSACVCAALDLLPVEAQQAAPPSGGIASASLCADSYVLALAEPGDIRALSWQVDQPVSAAPDWARSWPQAWADAERILALQPDLTVFGTGEGGRTAAVLGRAGHDSVELGWASDFAGVEANLTELGRRLARNTRAEAVIENQQARLADLEFRTEQRGVRPRVVYLSSSGGSAGTGTYVDAAIRAAGGINAVAEGGAAGWTRSDPEFALEIEADILVTSFFRDGFASTFNRALSHAAYWRLVNGAYRVDVPSGDWPCASPRLVDAAERIADAIDDWLESSREDIQ